MPNLFQDPTVTTGVLARESLISLQNNLVMANLVHRDYSQEFKKVGDTVSIRKPASFVANEFNGTTSYQDITEGSVDVQLQYHLDVSFKITSKEQSLSLKDFTTQLINPAMEAHAQKIDYLLLTLANEIPYHVGAAGTTPDGIDDLTNLSEILTNQKCPNRGRNLVVNAAAENKFMQLSTFHEANKIGDAGSALREGSMGRKFGFDMFMDQNVQSFALAGAGTVLIDNGAGYSIGDTALHFDGVTTALAAGDLVTIGGYQYRIESVGALATNDQDVVIYPGLKAAAADDDPVTLTASHVSNIGFHRNAFALATAPLEKPFGGVYSEVINYNGFSIRATFGYDMTAKSNIVSFDMLVGTKTLFRELAAQLLG